MNFRVSSLILSSSTMMFDYRVSNIVKMDHLAIDLGKSIDIVESETHELLERGRHDQWV